MTAPAELAKEEGHAAHPWVVATLSLAQLMFLLDATIINVALPTIQRAMDLSGPTLEWMVTAYSVPFGGLLLLGGRIGDILGRRRVFAAGVAVFTTASLLGGLALAPWWLLLCRAAQGIGAAAAYPATLALITAAFPDGPRRRQALGVLTAVGGSGGAIGLLAGGLITTYLSWRWVLFVNVPVGVFLLAMTPRMLPETARRGGRVDVAGAITITASVTLAVYALISGAPSGTGGAHWGDPTVLACLAAAVVLAIAFVVVERRSSRPLVPLRFFADRGRSGCYVVAILLNTAMFGIFFFMTLFLQRVWGYSPLHTAFVYVPLSGLLVAANWAGARIVGRTGPRFLIVAGLAIAAVGMAWLALIGHSGGYVSGMLGPTVLAYAGIGLTTVPQTLVAVARVAPEDSGLASGLYSASRQVGGATGLAVLGTFTWSAVAGHTLTNGIEHGFVAAAAITALAVLIAALTADPLRRSPAPPAAPP